jgi:hypothetical protein
MQDPVQLGWVYSVRKTRHAQRHISPGKIAAALSAFQGGATVADDSSSQKVQLNSTW